MGEGPDTPRRADLGCPVPDPTRAGDVKRKLVIKTDLDGQAPVTFTVEGTVTGP